MTAAAVRMSAIEKEIVVLDAEPDQFWFGAFRNLNLVVWQHTATMDAYKRLARTNPKRTQSHPEKITTVHIVLPSARTPDTETREALNSMHKQWGHTVGCAALVIEHAGFVGVAVRSAIAGMVLVAPQHYRVKVFDTIERAVPWLAIEHGRSTGVHWSEEDWSAVLRAARTAGTTSARVSSVARP